MTKRRMTVEELEALLNSPDPESIEILPDGSIRAVKGKPNHARPKVLTMEQTLGGDY